MNDQQIRRLAIPLPLSTSLANAVIIGAGAAGLTVAQLIRGQPLSAVHDRRP